MLSLPALLQADDYIDDAYYSPQAELSGRSNPSEQPARASQNPSNSHSPYYDKKSMQEFVFEPDTAQSSLPAEQAPLKAEASDAKSAQNPTK